MRPSVPLALGMIMLMTASAAAHGRVFIGAGVGVPVHPITVAPPTVVASFVTISSVPMAPQVPIVITPQTAIRPGPLVIVTRPSAAFFPQTVFISPPVQGAFPHRVTGPPRGVVPKVILVRPIRSPNAPAVTMVTPCLWPVC
jgi:hypothetical protein